MPNRQSKTPQSAKNDPVFNLSSIFSAHRDLKTHVDLTLGDSGLTVNEADIMVLLLGLREFGWPDCPVDAEGYVAFKDLKGLLVHDHSLFARRVKALAAPERGLVKVRRVNRKSAPGLHGNTQQLRITPAGAAVTRPIWERFRALSAKLFQMEPLLGITQDELAAHVKVNEAISQALRDLDKSGNPLL